MLSDEFKESVKTVGPAILILLLVLLYVYDQCVAAPVRTKVVRLETALYSMSSTIARIDERTSVLFLKSTGLSNDSFKEN